MSDSVRSQRQQPIRLPRPWDSPGKNIGVGCHFLLQCMKVKNESEVAQLYPTPSDPMDCSLPSSSIHGIFQATVLEWGAIAFSILGSRSPNKFSNKIRVKTLLSICSWKTLWSYYTVTLYYLKTVLYSSLNSMLLICSPSKRASLQWQYNDTRRT